MPSSSETRHIIRPEHFALAPQLLALELARPSRRLTALLVDLAVVAVLVHTAGASLLALAAAYAFFRFATRAPVVGSSRFMLRAAGALMLFILAKRGLSAAQEYGTGMLLGPETKVVAASAGGASKAPAKADAGVGAAVRLTTGVIALQSADDAEEVRRIAPRVVAGMRETGMDDEGIRDAMAEVQENSGKPWMAKALEGIVPAAPPAVPADSLAIRYAAALTAGDTVAAASLRGEVGVALSRDTVSALRSQVSLLRAEKAVAEQEAKEAGEGKGILERLEGLLDDLGLGFGWTGLYFTAFTALWKGQTPGKKLLGVRVLRLDGKPLTMWGSFERFGGYAAGLVTGLLGFAQVFWDRNRQAIHDKISETVVVRERILPEAPAAVPAPLERRAV